MTSGINEANEDLPMDDLVGSIVILDKKHKVFLIRNGKTFVTVRNRKGRTWDVMKRRLDRPPLRQSIQLKDIRKGMEFFEQGQYGARSIRMIALEDAQEEDRGKSNGYFCKAKIVETGKEIELFEAKKTAGYGLDLFIEKEDQK